MGGPRASLSKRHGKPHWTGRVELVEHKLDEPLHWKEPTLIFVNSMSDIFHEKLPFEVIERIFDVIRRRPEHQFQTLTKRAARMAEMAPDLDWPSNLWVGVSVGHPKYLNRLDCLRRVPAAIRFASGEPLIASLRGIDLTDIHWLIAGGESGPGWRPMDLDWVRELRDASQDYRTSFFYKQGAGHNPPENPMLDGHIHHEFPRLKGVEIVCDENSWIKPTKLIQIAPKIEAAFLAPTMDTERLVSIADKAHMDHNGWLEIHPVTSIVIIKK
jgi:protein gp37